VTELSYQRPLVAMKTLCELFGYGRQAWYEAVKRKDRQTDDERLLVSQIRLIRLQHHKVGAEKLYFQMKDWCIANDIKIGRDKFFNILRSNGLMIQRRTRKAITTNSKHNLRRYPNLIKGTEILRPNQLWVSDMTYLTLARGFIHMSLVTDAYSRKIVGWSVHKSLQTEGPLLALKKALRTIVGKENLSLIHHSDRGVQYCSRSYIQLLKDNKVSISMTENGDPYENALAERMNRTLKEEFSLGRTFFSYEQAKQLAREAIEYYNQTRPHASCNYLTPSQAHERSGVMIKKWRPAKSKTGKMQNSLIYKSA
jgi:putative transposase